MVVFVSKGFESGKRNLNLRRIVWSDFCILGGRRVRDEFLLDREG